MEKDTIGGPTRSARRNERFVAGALVIVTLSNPREKFWGMILALAPEGLSVSGEKAYTLLEDATSLRLTTSARAIGRRSGLGGRA